MRIKGSLAKGFLIALAISLIPVAATSAQKVTAGSKCKVFKQKVTHQSKVYTCIKSGKKLVWNKGVVIVKPTPTPTPTPTPKPTPTPAQEQIWSVTEHSLLDNSEKCEIAKPEKFIEDSAYYAFPRVPYFLPTKGVIRSLIIPVAFADAPGLVNTASHAEPFITEFKKYWTSMSRGAIEFDIDVLGNWLELPKTSYEYSGETEGEQQRMGAYVQEVINRVDPFVDFSQYKIVYIIPTDNLRKFFSVGPVVSSGRGSYFMSSEGPINNLIFGTKPEFSLGGNKWRWLAHETGHLFGILHPHSYDNNDKKLASIFSLMDFGFVEKC